MVFNGVANQYADRPIEVGTGETNRIFVLNAGPSVDSSFHIVGTIFDTVYKEGEYLLRPGAGQGGSQALDLQPSQGGFVEFTFDEAKFTTAYEASPTTVAAAFTHAASYSVAMTDATRCPS